MSSDNYLWLTKRGRKYVVLMGFASDDGPPNGLSWAESTSLKGAIKAAHKILGEEIVEYGLRIDPAVVG